MSPTVPRKPNGLAVQHLVMAAWLVAGLASLDRAAEPIVCQGEAGGHLQGFDSDGQSIYWSMYDHLFKTDYAGKVLAERTVKPHHGDCCLHDGKLYVATSMHNPRARWVYAYTADNLTPAGQYEIHFEDDAVGLDGIVFVNGSFYLGEGKDPKSEQDFNWIHQYTPDFQSIKKFRIPGKTTYGVQAMTFAGGFFWLGTYSKDHTYQCDVDLKVLRHHALDISVGAFELPRDEQGRLRLMVARNVKKPNGRWTASAAPAVLIDGVLTWEK